MPFSQPHATSRFSSHAIPPPSRPSSYTPFPCWVAGPGWAGATGASPVRLAEILAWVLAGILAWILAGILAWILAGILAWILAGILSWILAGILAWILAGILAWILAWTLV